MPRYIDADALLKHECEADKMGAMLVVGKGWILEAPAVDAVEVVFCKDCIYQKDAKVNCKGFIICPASNMEITDDDYCSYGKRKAGQEV